MSCFRSLGANQRPAIQRLKASITCFRSILKGSSPSGRIIPWAETGLFSRSLPQYGQRSVETLSSRRTSRTRFALHFGRPAGDGRRAAVGAGPVFFPVALADFLRRGVDFLGVSAKGALERPLAGTEIELGAAAGTRKFSARRRFVLRFFGRGLGLGLFVGL